MIGCQIPYFNAPIFLENKTQVGKIEEIFGPINKAVRNPISMYPSRKKQACRVFFFGPVNMLDSYLSRTDSVYQMFTIKMQEGVVATSYSEGDKFHIDPMKLLPLERFTGGGGGGGRGRGGA